MRIIIIEDNVYLFDILNFMENPLNEMLKRAIIYNLTIMCYSNILYAKSIYLYGYFHINIFN